MATAPDDQPDLSRLPYDHPLRAAARHRELQRLHDETLALHQANPAVQEWLRQFRGDGSGFLDSFASARAESLTAGRRFYKQYRAEDRELAREGRQRLWEIQQRKLFGEQVRWRAGEPTLATRYTKKAAKFERWGYKIKRCYWLPVITPAEVEDYLAYLASDDCTDADPDYRGNIDWQDYDTFKRFLQLQADGLDPVALRARAALAPSAGASPAELRQRQAYLGLHYPGWYAWCDRQAGPPNPVLHLPDLHGFDHLPDPDPANDDEDEEDDQPSIFRTPPPAPPPAPTPPGLPWLSYADYAGLTATLMREQETPELQRYHQAHLPTPAPDDAESDPEADDRERRLNNAGHLAGQVLVQTPVRRPIAAGADWRISLYHTWVGYRKELLAEAVRVAYAAYQQRHPPPA